VIYSPTVYYQNSQYFGSGRRSLNALQRF